MKRDGARRPHSASHQGRPEQGDAASRHVALPLVRTPRTASPDELSPDRISDILFRSDIADLR